MEDSSSECEYRLMPESSGFFQHVALACWDNVLGPRTRCVWSATEAPSPLPPRTTALGVSLLTSSTPLHSPVASLSSSAAVAALRYLPQLMLSGEACYDSRLNAVDSRLFRIDEGDLVAFGLVFSALSPLRRDIVSHCLVSVVPGPELPKLVAWRPAIEHLMRRAVRLLQVLLHKGPAATAALSSAEDFSSMDSAVAALCDVVVYLRRCGLSRAPKIEETLLGNNAEILSKVAEQLRHRGSSADSVCSSSGSVISSVISSVVSSSGSSAAVPMSSTTPGADLLQLTVYAHLLSFGRSIVLGHCAASIDSMVKTLSLFCSGVEKQRCCIINVPTEFEDSTVSVSTEAQLWRFVPELCVQGLLLPSDLADKEAALEQLASDILQAQLPYAVVRLDFGGSVYLSSTYDVHVLRGRHAERRALHDALTGELTCATNRGGESCELRSRMQPVQAAKDASRFASFFKELRLLPTAVPGTVHESFVLQYMHYLQRQASVLIHALKSHTLDGASRNAADIMRVLFPLEHADDVKLIVATAERLQPGCCDLFMLQSDAGLPHSEAVTEKTATIYTSL